jgi:hypothetical protein
MSAGDILDGRIAVVTAAGAGSVELTASSWPATARVSSSTISTPTPQPTPSRISGRPGERPARTPRQ